MFLILGVCSALYCLLSIPLYLRTGNVIHTVMVWNLFLADLPLIFAFCLQKCLPGRLRVTAPLWGLLWLLFYPNAPYLVTDLMHMRMIKFVAAGGFIREIMPWLQLLQVTAGYLLGTLTGLLSLYLIHGLLQKAAGKVAAWGLLGGYALLSGYGIYIGRFLRLNSWDALHPLQLLTRLAQDSSPFAFFFSCLLAGYILLSYWLFYIFCHAKLGDLPGSGAANG